MPSQPPPPALPQLEVEPLMAVTEAELRSTAVPAGLAERLARLDADGALMLRLQLEQFRGKDWDAFLNVLAGYGRAVIHAWIHQGTIFRRCAERGIRLSHTSLYPKGSEAGDLATNVVVQAIISFHEKVLVPGRWNPAMGATLKTYFVGQCLFQFPNSYRAWVLSEMQFVFLCLDSGEHKDAIIASLESAGVPFIDVGMGVHERDGALVGILRVTTSTPAKREHVRGNQRVSLAPAQGDNDYSRNIQVADLNALNAVMAVIKWKKLCGFYHDLGTEHHSTYVIETGRLTREDRTDEPQD